MREPPQATDDGDEDDDSRWREDLLALRQIVSVLALRLAARAENPFDELETIRRLSLERAGDNARVMSPRRNADAVEREIDAIVQLAEGRIM